MPQAAGLHASPATPTAADKINDGLALDINGKIFHYDGDPQLPLLWYLRDVLRITGTKTGGEHESTGPDLVLVNNKAVSAHAVTLAHLVGKKIVTVEGLASDDDTLHPLQQAFIDEDAIGCGYCTPGWLIASMDLLYRKPAPSDEDIDALPNLCRCGCQTRVRRAIKRAAPLLKRAST